MELSLHPCYNSLGAGNRMHENLSLCWVHYCEMFLKIFCNPLSMLVVKKTRIPTPVLLPKLWHWLQTAHIAIKLWIAVAIQLQSIRMMKRHMHRLTIKCSRVWAYQKSIFPGRACQIWKRPKRTNNCRLPYPAVGYVENVGALLHVFVKKILR